MNRHADASRKWLIIGAGDGGRTRTPLSGNRILSPVRMPVSPLLHDRLTGSCCDRSTLRREHADIDHATRGLEAVGL
jgi:hypothetical protein